MRIIIVGCGKVGYTLAKNLAAESGVDLTIIDNKPNALDKASGSIDAMLIKGDGLNANTLTEAGIKETDLLISVTGADETNILCCISAKRLGAGRTIARVRNPEYAFDSSKFWKDFGLDLIINPELETAKEISRLIRFPTVDDIDIFVGGRVELVSFKITEASDFLLGKSVSQIFHNKKTNILLAMIERNKTVLIPRGDLIFAEDDVISMLGRPSDVMAFFSLIGVNMEKIKSVVIVGGSSIAYYLVELLIHGQISNDNITIIEISKERCEELSVTFPRCLVLNGDGTDDDILNSEEIDKHGAVVCVTNRDEENAVIALYAAELGARKVIVKINHINQNMVKNLGLGSIVSPKNITSDQIIRYIRGLSNSSGGSVGAVYTIYNDDQDKVQAIELNDNKKAFCIDKPIKNLNIKDGILIGCIVKSSGIVIPTGDSVIQFGDSVIVIAKNKSILELDDILAN